MLHSRKFTTYLLFVLAVSFVFCTGDAYADNIMKTIRNRAANILVNLKPAIFVLGGFGLIGFAFAAIFGKISWKWFSHIAIGLFLVSNMGLFIDYFITRTGKEDIVQSTLGYGNYLDADYSGTSGTGSGDIGGGNSGDNLSGGDGSTPSEDTSNICTPTCEAGKSCVNKVCVASGSNSGSNNNSGGGSGFQIGNGSTGSNSGSNNNSGGNSSISLDDLGKILGGGSGS